MRAVIAAIVAWPLAAQAPNIEVPPSGRSFPSLIPLQAPAQTGKASIEGTVVDALTHNPVGKASVQLNGRASLNAVTGVDGRFAFRQLVAGQYVVQARAEKYPIGQFSLELGRQATVSVTADEQKTGVTLSLTPGGSLRGRIVDEEGFPMPQCSVSAMRHRVNDNGPALVGVGGSFSSSDEKGEYRIQNIPAGKYYLQARCPQTIPMPHAFVPREALAGLPSLSYPPLFYPGSSELSGAAKVSVTPGGDLAGIDFQMTPATGVGLRGRVRPVFPVPSVLIYLRLNGPDLGVSGVPNTRPDLSTGEFRFPAVRPGSYVLEAAGQADGRSYFVKTTVEVGASMPEPVDLVLQPVPQINGSISFDGDVSNMKLSFKNLRVAMYSIDDRPMPPPAPAEVQEDGSFVIADMPGRSRLQVSGAPGYIKSVMLGDQEVSPSAFEVGAAPGSLKIVMGTKYAQVNASVSGSPANAGPVMGVVWSAGPSEFQQNISVNGQPATLSVPPGRYYMCALAAAQPGMLLQDRAFRKALEGHCQTVEASENSPATVQIPLIPADEVKRLIDALEADDRPGF